MHKSSVRGTLPCYIPSSLEMLYLWGNRISGTVSQFQNGTVLKILGLSSNRLSGTLPDSACYGSKMDAMFLDNLRLSGTLPECRKERSLDATTLYAKLTTFGASRNFLEGTTDMLTEANNLQTIILASNLLSGNVMQLHNATMLGKGVYHDPTQVALRLLGAGIKKSGTTDFTSNFTGPIFALVKYIGLLFGSTNTLKLLVIPGTNPFELREQNYTAAVLIFPGNSQLTTEASYLPPTKAGAVLEADYVRSGSYGIFSGHTDYKMIVWVTVPVVVVLHVCALVGIVGRKNLVAYLKPTLESTWHYRHGVCLRTVETIHKFVLGLAICGVAVFVLNLWAPQLIGSCSPILWGSSACNSRRLPQAYQYIWSTSISATFVVACEMCIMLWKRCGEQRAVRAYTILLTFSQSHDHRVHTLASWQTKVWHGERGDIGRLYTVWWRRCGFWALCLPVALVLSIPDFLYGVHGPVLS